MVASVGPELKYSTSTPAFPSKHDAPVRAVKSTLQVYKERKKEGGRAWQLTPVIPALWEAEVGGSPENHVLQNTNLTMSNHNIQEKYVSSNRGTPTFYEQEMGFHHVSQDGLKLLISGDPPTSASQSTGITGIQGAHRHQLKWALRPHTRLDAVAHACNPSTLGRQEGLALLPRLEWSTVMKSQFTAALIYWVHGILLSLQLGLQACATVPG
ncbi:hypothetical protein AAY473_023601 [Plecturocebus cupreus]